MVGFWKFFLDNRAFTYFLTFLSILAGGYAVMTIPKESTPEITIPIAVISTPFFGASAQDVESLVTDKIEARVATISDIKQYTSTSRTGFSSIVVEFEQNVDIDERVTRLKEAVDSTKGELPSDGNDPSVTKIEFSNQPVLTVSLVADVPPYVFQQIVDELEEKILEVDGVARVNYFGIPEREIALLVDNRKLIETGIDFGAVVQALSSANVTRPVGSIIINSVEYPLDLKAEVATFNDLRSTPIAQSGVSSLGIADIADISNGYKPEDTITRVGIPGSGTQNSVTLNILKKDGGDITKITAEVRDLIEASKEDILIGVETVVTNDAGKSINDDLSGLLVSGLQTVFLVFIVLFFAVGVRESIIAAISIPISFMLAFVAFLFVGNTINFISLFALILSVGILVDTAIVVVEGINAKIQEGKRRQDAAVETIQEYGIPLIAGTMTTIGVFFPLLFLSGITGQFIAGIPYTIIFVLLASLFVSLAFVTVWCATFLKNREHIDQDGWFNRQFTKLENNYKKIIQHLLNNAVSRRLFQAGIVVAFLLSIGLVATGLIKVEFFPAGDLEFAYVNIERPSGASLEQTDEYVKEIEALLQNVDFLDSYVTTIGETSAFSGNDIFVGDQYANITLNVSSERQSDGLGLLDGLREQAEANGLADADITAAAGGPPTGAPVEVVFTSENTELLRETARSAEALLNNQPGAINVSTTLPPNNSGFNIIVDRNALFRFGVSLNAVATAIVGATDGIELFDITENGQDVTVIVKNKLDFEVEGTVTKRITPDRLSQLQVSNNRGESILLGSLVSVELAEADSEISRTDGERNVTVTSELTEGSNANEVRAAFRSELEEIMPAGVAFSFGGEAAEQDQSFAEVGIAFLVGIFLMFSILILQFGKWRQTFIILSVIPFALAGVLLGLFVSGNALSFPATLGLIALAGIVVNNSIILVSVFNQLRVKYPEWSLEEVVTEGSRMRLRPVVLTTVTTIIGVSPLLTQSALWSPIAYAIIFGLAFCIFVTLALVPLVYRRFEGFREAERRDKWSWLLTLISVLIFPITIAVIAAIVIAQLSGESQLGLLIFAVVAGLLIYVLTHVRKHK